MRDTNLPVPSVLVVGDLRQSASPVFAKKAWREIADAYGLMGQEFGPPPEPRDPPPPATEVRLPKDLGREACKSLYPIPFSDADNFGAIRGLFYQYFRRFDIWAVVSCGTAKNSRALLSALSFSDVPVLITVDSTLEDWGDSVPSVLRLIPNNEQQAQAIIGKAISLEEGRKVPARIQLFCYPSEDLYVSDLGSAIRDQADRDPREPNVTDLRGRGVSAGMVICVGYHKALQQLNSRRVNARCIIMSDGCYDDPRVRLETRRWHAKTTKFFWMRPLVDPWEYGADAYRAAVAKWTEVGRGNSYSFARGIRPHQRLTPFIELVKQKLEALPSRIYRFHGRDNRRGGYIPEELPRPRMATGGPRAHA